MGSKKRANAKHDYTHWNAAIQSWMESFAVSTIDGRSCSHLCALAMHALIAMKASLLDLRRKTNKIV
jgi:hypothetical protein